MNTVHIVVPTFREPRQVDRFLAAVKAMRYRRLVVRIVNCNAGDETTGLIAAASAQDNRIHEVAGTPNLFWSGAQNLGLSQVLAYAVPDDFVLFTNIDVELTSDVIPTLLAASRRIGVPCQIGGLVHANGILLSNGVKVRSWALGLNDHPLRGEAIDAVARRYLAPMDYMPTRCLLFPVQAVRECGVINERRLPHYAADYEFTNRLRRGGYQPYLCGLARASVDEGNTGHDIYTKKMGFWARASRVFHIKSSYNVIHRVRFVALAYPWYAVPTATLAFIGKTVVEVLFGGWIVTTVSNLLGRSPRARPERGEATVRE